MTSETIRTIIAKVQQWEGSQPGSSVTIDRDDAGSVTIRLKSGDLDRTLHFDPRYDDGRAMNDCDRCLDRMTLS
jgi:hypothetical protein